MKISKKILALLLAVVLVAAAFAGCSKNNDANTDDNAKTSESAVPADFKVGFICLHDENSTYDKNFIDAAKEACKNLGLKDEQVIIKTGIGEDESCLNTALDLVDQGCDFIFADSFGHESYIIEAAQKNPDVQFSHATGTKAHTQNLPNYHNAFASIYEGRYLAGIAAGLKLNEMIDEGKIKAEEAKIGYVGAYPYAEVKSGYTSFFLGARSICKSATMEVKFTNSWYDEALEKEAANTLINDKCVLISQHADSMGAPTACEAAGVPDVSYNGSTKDACPNTFIVSSRINWIPYFEYAISAVMKGEAYDTDWTGTIETGSVVLTEVNETAAAKGTQDVIDEAKAKLQSGETHVFDTSTFTVKGKTLDSYLADVDDNGDFVAETEAIKDGYFAESTFRSAPYFDVDIDGITIL